MTKLALFVGLLLLVVACGESSSAFHSEAECNAAPFKQGEIGVCGYYPGYGWAHVPVATSIRQN